MGTRTSTEKALDEFLAADVDRLSVSQLQRGLRAAGVRALPTHEAALRHRAREMQNALGGVQSSPAPPAHLYDDDDDDDDTVAREKIIAFYREHNPTKVQDVDALIAKYREVGVGASELLIAVQKKYSRQRKTGERPNQFSV